MIPRLIKASAAAALGCVAYGVLVERTDFQVRRVEVPVLPEGARPVRVLHFSDVHLLPRQTRKRDFLRGLAGLEPDLVVSTGDNISSADAIGPLMDDLGRLFEAPGVFVFGSNDYTAPQLKNPLRYLVKHSGKDEPNEGNLPTDQLRAAFESRGWVDVTHVRHEVETGGVRFAVRGTADAHEGRDDYATVAGPAVAGAVNLGVTHAPYLRLLTAMTDDGVDLICAGHTHGGQVCVPGKGALITNCDLPPEFAKGLFEYESGDKSAWVHVSAGVGMSPFAPYRFACPPEVTLMTLIPRPSM